MSADPLVGLRKVIVSIEREIHFASDRPTIWKKTVDDWLVQLEELHRELTARRASGRMP